LVTSAERLVGCEEEYEFGGSVRPKQDRGGCVRRWWGSDALAAGGAGGENQGGVSAVRYAGERGRRKGRDFWDRQGKERVMGVVGAGCVVFGRFESIFSMCSRPCDGVQINGNGSVWCLLFITRMITSVSLS
jgi:hypothetical protein